MRRPDVTYTLHHLGIPSAEKRDGERYAAVFGMYTSDDLSGPIPIQWHRYDADSSLHPLLREHPHVAYKVSNLESAIAGHSVLLGPHEPIDNFRVAAIDNAGMPIELIQTTLTDDEIWSRALSGHRSSLYSQA